MQRSSYKAIDRYYNQGTLYNVPTAVFRRSVMPGQTANLSGTLSFRTAALPVSLSKMVVSTSYFFVPYRLLWTDWVDFITDGSATMPTGPQCNPLFDTELTGNNAMMRRAYKLVYNEYFGDVNVAPLYDVDLDTFVTLTAPVLQLEQRLRELLPSTQFTDDEFVAPVDGTPEATINLSDFSRANASARRDFKFEKSGDKYVDYLRTFGVNPNWETQTAPEHLGSVTRDVVSRVAAATDGAALGQLRSYYSAEIPHSFKSKRFDEHGIVIGIAYARPVLFNTGFLASDVLMNSRSAFFNGVNTNIKADYFTLMGGSGGGDVVVPPSFRYTAGQHVLNNNGNADMALTVAGDGAVAPYTGITINPSEATLGTDSFAFHNDVTWSGNSPASTALVF